MSFHHSAHKTVENSPSSPPEIEVSAQTEDKSRHRDVGRTVITAAMVGAWSNIDYVALIAAGEVIQRNGVPDLLAASTIAGITAVQTMGISYAASRGMGDFNYRPKSKAGKKFSEFSPLASLWRGAGTGVMIDQATGRDVTFKRRLVHSLPYGVAVGAWVASPVPEIVANEASKVVPTAYNAAEQKATGHPFETIGLIGVAAIAAVAYRFRRTKDKSNIKDSD